VHEAKGIIQSSRHAMRPFVEFFLFNIRIYYFAIEIPSAALVRMISLIRSDSVSPILSYRAERRWLDAYGGADIDARGAKFA